MADSKTELIAWLDDPTHLSAQLPNSIKITNKLDDGGQGIVFKGELDGRPAAIKLYLPGQNRMRVDREIKALESIKCRSIASLLWAGEVEFGGEQLPIVVTEFIDGMNLRDRIAQTALTESETRRLIYDVAVAISDMWSRNIVHRDLKPANIIQRTNGEFCVIDLGYARHLDETSLTGPEATWGTRGYLSPEQTKAIRQLTCKSDIFSLGVTAVEAQQGRHPTNRNQERLISTRLNENLPPEIVGSRHATILMQMLNLNPVQRPMPEVIIATLQE